MKGEIVKLVNGVKITGYNSYKEVIEAIENKKREKSFVVANYMYWVSFVKSKKILNIIKHLKYQILFFPMEQGYLHI